MSKIGMTRNRKLAMSILVLMAIGVYYILPAFAQTEIAGFIVGVQFGNNYTSGVGYLSGVNVTAWNQTSGALANWTLTGSGGYFEMDMGSAGYYDVNFTKTGYTGGSLPPQPVNFTVGDNRTLYLYMPNVGSFNVTVIDGTNGRPIPGATVKVEHGVCVYNKDCPTAATNTGGSVMLGAKAEVDGSPVQHTMNVTAPGYSRNDSFKITINEAQNKNVTIRLNGKYNINGYVRDNYRCSGCPGWNIQGAFVEMKCGPNDADPKLNWSGSYFYNKTIGSSGYYSIYYPSPESGLQCNGSMWIHASATGYVKWRKITSGSAQTDIYLNGTAWLSGLVVDNNNKSYRIGSATVEIKDPDLVGTDTIYIINTISGVFNFPVKNGENHTLTITKNGYKNYVDTTRHIGNYSYGQINLTGNGQIRGTAADEYNTSIKITNANVTFVSSGGPSYITTTNANGLFSLNVSSAYSYTLTFTKQGYQVKTVTGVTVGSDSINNLGNVKMRGNTQINGTLTDCYSNLQLPGNKIENATINVISTTGGMPNRYRVFSDYYGFYRVYIPSTVNTYNIQFTSSYYETKTINQGDPKTQCLNGNVTVAGKVVDTDAVPTYQPQEGVYIRVYDDQGTNYYTTYTDSDGNYTIKVGEMNGQTNYSVQMSKTGYYTLYYINNTRSQAWNTGGKDYNELVGKTLVQVTVIDQYENKQKINGSDVCAYLEEQEFNVYQDCVYKKVTDVDGFISMNIRERDPTHRYNVKASKYGYSENLVGPFSGNKNLTLELYAATTVKTVDPYATPSYRNIQNATVILYYNFTQRSWFYSVNQTIVNITATCNNTQRNGLNVTMKCTNCKYAFTQSIVTAGGLDNATFYRVPVGLYNVTVNGSSVGCGVATTQVNVNEGGKTFNFSRNVNFNGLIIRVNHPGGSGIANATVLYLTNPSMANCTTDSNGDCWIYGMPSGANRTFRATHANYQNATKNYTVISNTLTDRRSDPMVMTPNPGDLSILVQGSVIQNANVSINNGTNFWSQLSDANGWANFTSITSVVTINVNGSTAGYNYTLKSNYLVPPDVETVLPIKLTENWILTRITELGTPVYANVTLWKGAKGSSPMVQNSSGHFQTKITNSTGHAVFRRLPIGTFTMSIYNGSLGIDDTVQVNSLNYYYYNGEVEGDLEAPEYSGLGDNISGSVGNGGYVKVYAYWTDNLALSHAVLRTNVTGSWANTTTSLSGTGSWSNFTIGTLGKTGQTIGWRLYANDTTNNWTVTPIQTFNVIATTLTVTVRDGENNLVGDDETNKGVNVTVSNGSYTNSSHTSDIGYVTFILAPGSYNIAVNGSHQGYGLNSTSGYQINPGSNPMTLRVNITQIAVNVTTPSGTPVTALSKLWINSSTSSYLKYGNGNDVILTSPTSGTGVYTIKRLRPCSACNVSIDTGSKINNSYPVAIAAGNHIYRHIDPPAPPVRSGMPGHLVNVTIAVTAPNVTTSLLDNLTITLWQDGVALNYSNLTVNGNGTFINLPAGYYNVTIDGWDVGFGRFITSDEIAIGKIVANSGKTNTLGSVSLEINGMITYFIRILVSGYNMFDDIVNGSSRIGTQTLTINLTGSVNVSGNVSDANFLDFTPSPPFDPVAFEPVDNAAVSFYRSTACSGLQESQVRYKAEVNDNGSYSLKVSPYVFSQDSSVYETYCIQSVATGYRTKSMGTYQYSVNTSTIDIEMVGDSYVTGQVRDIISLDAINGSKYPTTLKLRSEGCYGGTNCEAYQTTTNGYGNFYFNVSSRSIHEPYTNINIDAKSSGWCEYNLANITIPRNQNHYMIGSEYSMVNMTVNSSDGEDIINNITIKIKDLTSGDSALLGTLPTCKYNATNGRMKCYITSGTKTLTFNGSPIGYGINQTTFFLSTTNCNLQSMAFVRILNMTRVNITLRSDTGELIDGITVTMNSPTFQAVTANGSVLFEKVPGGSHSFTLAGNMTDVYFFNNSNTGTLAVTDAMAGKLNLINYTLNETRFSVTVTNETGTKAGILDMSFTNTRTSESWSNTTDANGYVLKTRIKYGNVSVTFNSSQLYPLGLAPPGTVLLTVTPGENENTTNNLTIALNDTEVKIRAKNSTSGLAGANVTMYLAGAVAQNANGETLTGLTDSSGYVTFHHVKPSVIAGTYTYVIDANSTGYGKWNWTLALDPQGASISKTLTPLKLSVYVYKEGGSALSSDVNISMQLGGSLAKNARGQYLNATAKSTAFQYLYNGNYSVLVNSSAHFSQSKNFNTYSAASADNTMNFYLSERTLHVYVRDIDGSTANYPVNITLRTPGGSTVTGTNGTTIPDKNLITNYTKFEYIPDGEYVINITSNNYFKTGWTFNTTDLYSIGNTKTFTLSERTVTVNIYNMKRSLITTGMIVSIMNSSGIVKNTTGTNLNSSTSTGTITFTGVPDGVYNISVTGSGYTGQNQSLDTSSYTGAFAFYMKVPGFGYFNVTTMTGSSILTGTTLTLYNGTTVADTGTTGSGGWGTVQANVSVYSTNLTITASRSGYNSNSTTGNSVSDGEVKSSIIKLTASTAPPPGPGGPGAGTSPSGGPGPSGCTERWTCTAWSECPIEGLQTRTCTDDNRCGSTRDKPAVVQGCVYPVRKMEISINEINVKAGRCTSVNLYVDNTGTIDLDNVYTDKLVSVPDCCDLETSKTITTVRAGTKSNIPVSVCAAKDAEKGIYKTSMKVISGGMKEELNVTIKVTMTYIEVLNEEVDAIEETLGKMKDSLTGAQTTIYLTISGLIGTARNQIANGDLDGAEKTLTQMKDLMKDIETAEGADFSMLLIVIMMPVIGVAFVCVWWLMGRRRFGKKYTVERPNVPSLPGGQPIMQAKEPDPGAVMMLTDNIRERFSGINMHRLNEKERYYYENLKKLMEDIVKYIKKKDFKSAMVFIENSEKYLDILERGIE
ncbi:MAG: carboxypeptidase regulatory-like domain-containing protein [Candidatus Aenigmarchaeota archaeon]|nr:carboxypeptidase regulatory-like domain-containing protein [Candidatus Aenigmarchaeota archaeon]